MQNLSYRWRKENDYPPPTKGNVFGTFVCGGGSTMGYKLAGFNHLGGVEIDQRMAKLYRQNHNPKYFYLEDIRLFNMRKDLPSELYNLDILDGSPPCTTFSMNGKREKGWGKEKRFNEGQTVQTLDDLVFVYCSTIEKLKPKVAILENVPGIVAGRAKKYTIEVYERLQSIGYDVQIFQLNAATMGVPQSRERIFFVARRKDLGFKPLVLTFIEPPVTFGQIAEKGGVSKPLWPSIKARWPYIERGDQNLKFADKRYRNKESFNAFFSTNVMYDDVVHGALTSGGTTVYYDEERNLTDGEYRLMSSFPLDYDFLGQDVRYVCGMSVPPLMTARISEQIWEQWFNK